MSNWIQNEYRDATPERKKSLNEATKRWRSKNPEKIKEIRQRTDAKRKEKKRHNNLMKNYGISLDDYLELLKTQNGVCAICKQPETKINRHGTLQPLCVDHCHINGHVRGLLCSSCNLGIGNLKDNIEYLLNAVEYLRRDNA
jgi:hypothetical protein